MARKRKTQEIPAPEQETAPKPEPEQDAYLTAPRTLTSQTVRFFRWRGFEWYGADAQDGETDGVAFLPAALYVQLVTLAAPVLDPLEQNAFFMPRAVYEAQATPIESPLVDPNLTTQPVVGTLGAVEEVF